MNNLTKRVFHALYQVSHCLGKPLDPHDTVVEILSILDSVAGYRSGTVTIIEPGSDDLVVEAAHGIKDDQWKNIRYKKGEGITGAILESGTPLAIPMIKNDPRFLHKLGIYQPESAFLGVPITLNNEIAGVLTVSVDASQRYCLDDHLKTAAIFGNLIGAVITRFFRMKKEKEEIMREKNMLQMELKNRFQPHNMIGASKEMQEVFAAMGQVAKWNTTVLVRGESGTGKELVAKAIHYQSQRSSGPFIKLNCAALPDTLLESELFGHERGAFTGAAQERAGRFELAHKGTLFLDEVGDTTPAFQAKLLRVLQEGQFERLGGTKTFTVDVRLIAATNVDLEKAVSQDRFREDLYYRLNVMPIFLPPLRERKEDIPHLVYSFLEKLGRECGETLAIDKDAMRVLIACQWPGNIRELENCLQRAAVTCKNNIIHKEDMPCTRGQCFDRLIHEKSEAPPLPESEDDILTIENERDRIIAALKRTGWVQAKAARILTMTPRQIAYRIQKLNIPMDHY